VIPMDTGWSDHRLITAVVHVNRPRIEKAILAPRLPDLETLDKSRKFWPAVLGSWCALSESAPISLETWRIFKSQALEAGLAETRAMKAAKKKSWVDALRHECIPPERIMDAVSRANRQVWSRRTPPARTPAKWSAAIPTYEVVPKQSQHFVPSKASPWRTPIKRPSGAPHGATAAHPVFVKPAGGKSVADLLQDRVTQFAKASKDKWEKMTRTHSSEWFKQSSNKELDERGSRASVSVEGLRWPGDDIARTDLEGMTAVAKDYFHLLHTPEPLDQARAAAQDALLEEVRLHGRSRPDPDPEDVVEGPFMEEEMVSLLSKMPNTAPGPDGIPYAFWKRLIQILAGLQDSDSPPRTFWSVFSDLTEDIAQ